MPEERMDVEAQLEQLNRALHLQGRSVLQYALTAGTLTGIENFGIADVLGRFAAAELDDLRRLVEKVTALGGDPADDFPQPRFEPDPQKALEQLIASEAETLETLQGAIEPTGREAASEAIEHRLEHIIMRKQEQVDVLIRATRPRGA